MQTLLITSDIGLEEIKKKTFYKETEFLELISKLGLNLKIVKLSEEMKEIFEIIKIKKVHYPDSLHTAVALSTKCDAFITWNKKDFIAINNLIEVLSPEDFT